MSRVIPIHGPNEQRPLSPAFLAGVAAARQRTLAHLERKEQRRRRRRRAAIAAVLLVSGLLFGFVASGLGMLAGLLLEAALKTLERL